MRADKGLLHTLLVDGIAPCAIAALLLVAALTVQHWRSLDRDFTQNSALDTQRLLTSLAASDPTQQALLLHQALEHNGRAPILRAELRQARHPPLTAGLPDAAIDPAAMQVVSAAVERAGEGTLALRTYIDSRALQRQLRLTAITGAAVGGGLLALALLSLWSLRVHVVRPWQVAGDALEAIGHDLPVSTAALAGHAEANRLAGIIAQLQTDVGHMRSHATTLRNDSTAEALSRLQQVQSMALGKSRFVSSVGHHFRQPLQALHLFIASLLADANQQQRGALEQMRACIDAMTRLLSALVDISRLDAGTQVPQPRSFSVSDLFSAEMAASRPLATRHKVRVCVHDGGMRVHSDRDMVARILHELVSNAISCASDSRVLIAARRHGTGVRIEVRDSGPGISTLNQRRIFDDFVQLPSAGQEPATGYGLGLAIAARMAAALDSHIQLRSAPGRGSTFAFTLGREPAASADAQISSDDMQRA